MIILCRFVIVPIKILISAALKYSQQSMVVGVVERHSEKHNRHGRLRDMGLKKDVQPGCYQTVSEYLKINFSFD